jgi:hypothetical protein
MKLFKRKLPFVVLYLWVFVLCLFYACGDTIVVEPSPDPGPPPPPPVECEQEVEANDSFLTADFLGIFPIISPETVCGDMSIWPPHDVDFFFFYLIAPEFVEEMRVSFVVTTDLNATPKIKLYQTVYDQLGNPTGEYQLVGFFVQGPGLLYVDQAVIPHNPFENNDLFVVLEAEGDPYHIAEYELEFWSN